MQIGGAAGWGSLAVVDGLAPVDGWQGGSDLALADRTRVTRDASDLFFTFDGSMADTSGRATIADTGGAVPTADAILGGGALALTGAEPAVVRLPDDSIFAPESSPGSVTIEFWLRPGIVADGANVLYWSGFAREQGAPVVQELLVGVENRRLTWNLTNLVRVPPSGAAPTGSAGGWQSAALVGRRQLVPGHWQHHRLEFDGARGRLAYVVDGVLEDIRWLTPSGREDGRPYQLYVGPGAADTIDLGERLVGTIDEVRIARRPLPPWEPPLVRDEPGLAVTEPLTLGSAGAHLRTVRVRAEEPGLTAVRVAYRVAEQIVSRDPHAALDAPWTEVPADGRMPFDAHGRYVQFRMELLPAADRTISPRISGITVAYEPTPPPPAVRSVIVEPVPEGLRVRWGRIFLSDIAGYRVHLGTTPGRYLGTATVASPVDAGDRSELVIEGLVGDRAYVVAVEAYDRWGNAGPLSYEVEGRAGRGESE